MRADDVADDEWLAIKDRTIDVTFGGHVDDRVAIVDQTRNEFVVADVAFDEAVVGVLLRGGEIFEIA